MADPAIISDPVQLVRPWVRWVALLAGLVVGYLFVRGVTGGWDFTTDDAYITLRYSRNLVEGHGIVWNVGESPPVEGYSNFTYVLLGAAAMGLDLDPVAALKWVGVLGMALGCVASWCLARTFVGPIAAWLPALFIVSYRGVPYWTASGLETGFFLGLTLAAAACWFNGMGFGRAHQRRASWLYAAYALAALVALTRPEGGLLAVVFGLGSWEGTMPRTVRIHCRPMMLFAVPVAAYFAWKLSHFNGLMPHSAQCKAMFAGDGSALTRDYWSIAALWTVLSLALPWRTLDRRHLVLWLYPLAYAVLLVGVDPIIGHWNRHALTPWALLVIAGCVALVAIAHRTFANISALDSPDRREVLIVIGAILWSFIAIGDHAPGLEREAAGYQRRMDFRQQLGDWLEARTTPDDWVAIGDCGLVPFRTHAKVLDLFCLNSREVSAPPVSFDAQRVADLVFERRPRFLVVHSRDPKLLKPRHEYGVFGAIAKRPQLASDYQLETVIGAPGDDFHYWVYKRQAAR